MTLASFTSDRPTFRRRQSAERSPPPPPPGNLFTRLVTVKALASLRRTAGEVIADELWPSDAALAQLVTRAVSAPAMTTVTGWAKELVHQVTADALAALGPASAGAQVLRDSMVLNFDGNGIISAPGLVASASNASFVAEGAPIPVRQLSTAAVQLLPYKLATIAVLTREMMESGNAERLIGDALVRACGAALDVVLFGSGAISAAQPAGLRNGIAALTASANADAFEAGLEDFTAVLNAVATVGGAGPYSLVMSPGRAAVLTGRLYREPTAAYTVYPSAAAGNDIIAIANAALVAAISGEPDVETANAATLHMESAPTVIVDGGTEAVPQRGLFQTESIAVKVRWPVSWALRSTSGVAWTTPVWK
jgi:hypothetical protein